MRMMSMIWMIWLTLGGAHFRIVRAQPMDRAQQERIIHGLSDSSFKVRLEAVILVGKQKIARALPVLLDALKDPHAAVRAAAAVSLARLGNQEKRKNLVLLLADPNKMVVHSAERALILLDKDRGGPKIFLVFDPQASASLKISSGMALWVIDKLREQVKASSAVVLSSGEEKVLSRDQLTLHLRRRKMLGFNIRAKISRLDQQPGLRSIRVRGEVNALVFTLTGSRVEFVATGAADAEIDTPRLTPTQQDEVEHTVFAAAAKASAGKTLEYLRQRLER